MRFNVLVLLGLMASTALPPTPQANAEDFRMETEVFAGRKKLSHTLTLFRGDYVYDFVQGEDKATLQTTVFDWTRKRIILLDWKRQLKTEVSTIQLLEVLDYLAQRVYQPGDDEFRIESSDKKLKLTGKKLVYEATGAKPKPKYATATSRYQKFADWYARLNATRMGNPPPFTRIRLNALLADKGIVPTQITRSMQGSRKQVRSTHATLWRLSKTDHQRISKTGDQILSFQAVSPEEYWRSERLANGRQ